MRHLAEKNKSNRKIKRYLIAAAFALVAVAVVLAAAAISLRSIDSPGETAKSTVSVYDIYEGQRDIPKFDLPESTLDTDAFYEENGFLCYEGAKLGIDVSEFQGEIDWTAVKQAGIEFVIMRVGYRGMTEGLLNADESFEEYYAGASEAGLKIGVYFFSQAISKKEAEEEADFVINALKGKEISYPVVFDWELPMTDDSISEDELRVYDITGEEAASFGAAFCKRIEKSGYTPCVYFNKSWAYEFFDLDLWADYDMWYAEYQNAPSLYYAFDMWQYTESGTVPGIDGAVDIDLSFKDYG